MNQPPLVHALVAGAYILGIVQIINALGSFEKIEDTMLAPMLMLSLLVLSVAVMAFLFGYRPLTLYLDGKKRESVSFFLRTIGYFAVFVGVLFTTILFAV